MGTFSFLVPNVRLRGNAGGRWGLPDNGVVGGDFSYSLLSIKGSPTDPPFNKLSDAVGGKSVQICGFKKTFIPNEDFPTTLQCHLSLLAHSHWYPYPALQQ